MLHKTEKSTKELELDMNLNHNWNSIIAEEGKDLKPLSGAGFCGLENLGNSCYMNSLLQTVFGLPEFGTCFARNAAKTFEEAPANPAEDLDVQMTKITVALHSGQTDQVGGLVPSTTPVDGEPVVVRPV